MTNDDIYRPTFNPNPGIAAQLDAFTPWSDIAALRVPGDSEPTIQQEQ
jgi:hypothetical protein